ncbi:hypothetical protein GLOTRDRAFT_61585 [Gloeophyllum trabeum ATCC 11539]|uniref:Wax synthase domain-containing protein n=1 Tax=Gloeophyllum trabeum (strain ATCC 11539 / FP-39264 / Madison 617) TaxID=670483 RepID=S7Q368_GLOTA|nr:uncharacterized protein GLOTRDRAFT_61585 [Gloeophyllum trabeum ATCC 11539]EPQ54466.1 hypothetical protein GLOTRDRAFT_61585 [Gloeophyllum trabeum ATCC 11539]
MNYRRIYLELWSATYAAWRTVVPEPQNRTEVTWQTAPAMLMHFLPLLFQAYLVRRPDTYLIRLLLLPAVLSSLLHVGFGYMWTDPRLNVYNWALGLLAMFLIARALDFAFVKDGRKKLNEVEAGVPRGSSPDSDDSDLDRSEKPAHRSPTMTFLPLWFRDALEILFTARGLGWDFGKPVYVPRDSRPQERGPFLRATLLSFLKHFCLLDFQESLIKCVPGLSSPYGGSIFLSNLPPLQRYAVSTFAHILTGNCFVSGFQMVYDLCTLIDVGLLGHSPSSWPPIMENPWATDSLHGFWARRWHQLFRQIFLVFGGYPGAWLAGNVGMVVGAFVASGLYHELAIYAMGRGLDHRVTIFFGLQGFMVILEKLWRMATGRRVGGWWGRLWCYFVIIVLGQPAVDAWHVRGLAGGMVIFPIISPTRRILFPAMRYLWSIAAGSHAQ